MDRIDIEIDDFINYCDYKGLSKKTYGNIYTLSQMLGHSSVQVTEQCYLDLKTEDLRKGYQRYSPLMN